MKMNTTSSSGLGTLPSNTVTNPKEDLKGITTRSGNAYQGPMIPTTSSSSPKVVVRETEETKDTMPPPNNRTTNDVQPSVVQIETLIPNSEPVVAPVAEPIVAPVSASKPNQKSSIPYPSRLHDQKLRDKANDQKEKFFQIFKDLDFNISFVDALILMPKFVPTIKSLLTNKDKLFELATTPLNEHCSAVLLKILQEKLGDPGKFLILCDFPGMDECLALFDLDASINLMPLSEWNKLSLSELTPTLMTLELTNQSFLKTKRAFIDVYAGELTLRVNNEAVTFIAIPLLIMTQSFLPLLRPSLPSRIVIFFSRKSTLSSLLKMIQLHWKLITLITIRRETFFFLKHFLMMIHHYPPPTQGMYLPQMRKELKICEAKNDKSSIDEPREVELKDLPPHLEYAFLEGWPVCIDYRKLNKATHKDHILDGFSGYIQILIDPKDQEKTTFTCPYGTFAYHRMPFGLCNAPGTFQSHKISKNEIKLDKAKVDVIAKLSHPTTVKGMSSQQKNKFFKDVKHYFWDNRFLFKIQVIRGVFTARKPLKFLRLSIIDPSGEIMAQSTTLKKCLTLDFIGPQSTMMPTTWSNLVTLIKVMERFHNEMKCLKTPSKFAIFFDVWGIDFMGPFCLYEGKSLELPMLSLVTVVRTSAMTSLQRSCLSTVSLTVLLPRITLKLVGSGSLKPWFKKNLGKDNGYGYCKYHKKTAKTGQKRTRERKEDVPNDVIKLMMFPYSLEGNARVCQLEIYRVSLSQEDVNLKFLRSLPSEWKTHTLIWRNKTHLEEQSLDDLFNSLKIYKPEVKSSSTAGTTTQNIAFVSSSYTNSITESVSDAANVSTISAQLPVSSLPNIDSNDLEEMVLKWQMAMLTMSARRFLQRTGRNLGANGPTSLAFDMSKVECYNCHRKGHFARECSSLYDGFQPSDGYHAVPSPYTGTFMLPKPDLVFNNAPNGVETDHSAFTVKLSPTKPDQDLSHTNRPSTPIIEDWVSDSEEESKTKASQIVPSFVQPPEQVKTPRPFVQHVETSIPTRTDIPNLKGQGNRRNRKACFVCKSLDHLIKDCDYHEKKMAQTTARTHLQRKNTKHYAQIPLLNPQRHVVLTAVVTQINSIRSVTLAVHKPRVTRQRHAKTMGNPQHALQDKGVINSGCSRHMTGNMFYLFDFEELNGGYVAFGGNLTGGKNSGKGKIRT
nr:reverse transcriptase domain-containing protein [Tanacetum cinerariifolium]